MIPPKNPSEGSEKLSNAMAEILEDALSIQDRFVPEPMLKTTGKGVLKSRGAQSLKQDADELRRKLGRGTGRES